MQEPENSLPASTDAATPPAEPAAPAAPEASAAPAEPVASAAPAAPAAPAIADLPPAAVAAKLAELFPALFGAGRALPIKLRIQADIQQRAPGLFNKKSLSIFLHRHTTSTGYLKALAQAPARLDLDGQPAGDVAQEHRDAAAAELNRRLALVQERRAAERKAQRQNERAAAAGAAPAAGGEAPQVPQAPQAPQSPRPPRPPRENRPPRPRPEQRREGGRPERPPRPDRPPRDMPRDMPRDPPRDRPQPRAAQAPLEPAAPREPLTPEQAAEFEARRGRAQLLRTFETSTLTRANFCALKGISDAALEAVLVQARAERGDRVQAPSSAPSSTLKAPRGGPISR